ncbi:DUF6879 family protein [Longispora albida]|uniref:DUF6879 family protein n=1 Tax=Longispora albida TaxID=203523 RepID=UPI00037B41E8|nr:DUF6879 family protein [Longispora albida]
MELLRADAFEALFRTFGRTAFRLELRDTYYEPAESGPFRLFLDGLHDDFAWHEPWLAGVRELTAAGKRMSRVRVVTVPHGDYTRWGLAVASLNAGAGEDIRWLPRELATGLDLPGDDFWLFDDQYVVRMHFDSEGRFAGGELTRDPAEIDSCRRAQRESWNLAIPHGEYR